MPTSHRLFSILSETIKTNQKLRKWSILEIYTYRQDYRDSAGCIYMVIHLYVYVTTEVEERVFNLR